jgi:hypothetical protein
MEMKAQRIRITEPGWASFTSHLGGVEFVDGLSVEAVAPSVINQLGAVLRIQAVDDNVQGGQGQILIDHHDDSAPVVEVMELQTQEELDVVTATASTPQRANVVVTERYTRTQLEKIADERGIAGLRVIATPLNLKGRGILELIDEILAIAGVVEQPE